MVVNFGMFPWGRITRDFDNRYSSRIIDGTDVENALMGGGLARTA